MTNAEFLLWRQEMGWTRQQAADALGISLTAVRNYETGKRSGTGTDVTIPNPIALACMALKKDRT